MRQVQRNVRPGRQGETDRGLLVPVSTAGVPPSSTPLIITARHTRECCVAASAQEGDGTLEYFGNYGWMITERYSGNQHYYFSRCKSTTPPLTRWEINHPAGTAPAPSLSLTTVASLS